MGGRRRFGASQQLVVGGVDVESRTEGDEAVEAGSSPREGSLEGRSGGVGRWVAVVTGGVGRWVVIVVTGGGVRSAGHTECMEG